MKKYIIILLLILISSCNNPKQEFKEETKQKINNLKNTEVKDIIDENKIEEQIDTNNYINEKYWFSLNLTENWKDYKINEMSLWGEAWQILALDFYTPIINFNWGSYETIIKNKEQKYPGYVELFHIAIYDSTQFDIAYEECKIKTSDDECMASTIDSTLRNNKYIFTIGRWYNEEIAEELNLNASKDVENIIKSFKLIDIK